MDDTIVEQAVTLWARETYQTEEIVVADVSQDEDEAERYLVILALRPLAYWLVAEVWLYCSQVEAINNLGEGLPLEDMAWPWKEGYPTDPTNLQRDLAKSPL